MPNNEASKEVTFEERQEGGQGPPGCTTEQHQCEDPKPKTCRQQGAKCGAPQAQVRKVYQEDGRGKLFSTNLIKYNEDPGGHW